MSFLGVDSMLSLITSTCSSRMDWSLQARLQHDFYPLYLWSEIRIRWKVLGSGSSLSIQRWVNFVSTLRCKPCSQPPKALGKGGLWTRLASLLGSKEKCFILPWTAPGYCFVILWHKKALSGYFLPRYCLVSQCCNRTVSQYCSVMWQNSIWIVLCDVSELIWILPCDAYLEACWWPNG